MNPKNAVEYYKNKALHYMAKIFGAAENGEDAYAKLMIGFYNDAVRDMQRFERLM